MTRFVSVSGLKELGDSLATLSQAAENAALRRVAKRALAPFDDAWRAAAPRRSGELEESGGIGTKLTRSQRRLVDKESAIEISAGPGPNPQAIQEEFGNYHQPARPFVRPAWDQTQDQVLDLVKSGLGDEVDKAAAKAARQAATRLRDAT